MLLSVIIPNYNGIKLLKEHLEANYRILEKEAPCNFEIIVTDDHSKDGSGAFVATLNLPNVRFLVNPDERGFGSNCNNGARNAAGKFVFFLNNDVALTEGFRLQPLIDKLSEEKVFSVVPRILRKKDNLIESLTSGTLVPGEIRAQSKNKSNKDPEANHKVLWGCGAALLCERELFFKLGGFADEFKIYYGEDIDLSLSAWRQGYQNWYVGQSTVTHDNSVTTKKEWKWKKRFIAGRNMSYFQYKHLPLEYRICRFRKKLAHFALRLNLFMMWVEVSAYLTLPKEEPHYVFSTEEVLNELNKT